MTNRYVIKFTKTGYIKYTSHLDLLRVFKRAFKKTGITLRYSQGFNPHPKMGFAQPLSLGYSSKYELIEFETLQPHSTTDIVSKMKNEMPSGIDIISCTTFDNDAKALAGDVVEAEYKILIPTDKTEQELIDCLKEYLKQPEITALKRMKKTKKMEPVDIKKKIRNMEISKAGEFALINAALDSGSYSNCSPELVISSFCAFSNIETPRYEVEVERTKIIFGNKLQF